jgi:hypothetical protein
MKKKTKKLQKKASQERYYITVRKKNIYILTEDPSTSEYMELFMKMLECIDPAPFFDAAMKKENETKKDAENKKDNPL